MSADSLIQRYSSNHLSRVTYDEAMLTTPVSSAWAKELHKLRVLHRETNAYDLFGKSLNVFGLGIVQVPLYDIMYWNDINTWKRYYGTLASHLFSFAQDIFGNQYCLDGDDIVLFDIETAETEVLCQELEQWLALLTSDTAYYTGYHALLQYELKNGPFPNLHRLQAIQPFVLGGEYDVNNYRAVPNLEVMKRGGQLAVHIAGIPDGAPVNIRLPNID